MPLVPLALGVAGCAASWQLSAGTLAHPGPGLWPLVVSVVLAAASLASLIGGLRRTGDETPRFTRAAWRTPVALGLMIVFTLALTFFGLAATVFGVLLVWLRGLSGESWRAAAVLAVATTAVLHLLFVVLLEVPMLDGYLPSLLAQMLTGSS